MHVEQRFAELARLRARPETKPLSREKSETFIVRQNIANCRELLASGKLEGAQRRAIETLLAE